MRNRHVSFCVTVTVVLGWSALNPSAAVASSPSPASSCVGQLSQGATPHGLSAAEPGDLGSFVSQLARSGGASYGGLTSGLAGAHGDLFACVATVPPLG